MRVRRCPVQTQNSIFKAIFDCPCRSSETFGLGNRGIKNSQLENKLVFGLKLTIKRINSLILTRGQQGNFLS